MNLVKGEGGSEKGETPAELLERVFVHIAQTRMADIAILNPVMRVEAVGFRKWEGRWIGVLVTPWTINLVLLPTQGAPLTPLALDEKSLWDFPSGTYEFMGLNEPAIGTCHICPLISPVKEFATHEEAQAVAQEIIVGLFAEGKRMNELAAKLDDAHLKDEAVSKKNMSRRDFLRMPFMGG